MSTLVSTSDHPARDQADYWRHAIREAFGPFHVRPAREGGFAARFRGRTLGPVEAGEVRAPAHAVRRGARQIAFGAHRTFTVVIPHRAVPPPSGEAAEAVWAIKEWIEAHLRDPDLTPAAIAAAHHVSVRQLYRLFGPSGTTVARYVRDRRLERCRRELSDPSQAGRRISAIARGWGLPDAAGFSRAFRAAYGLPPSAYRARALGLRCRD
ncbi:MAG TPA: helix-turn-helix domain-containing protein [Spirillospora sp.]|nr:helix-turn-helix domain-containing protein [Spirillospora sp.]